MLRCVLFDTAHDGVGRREDIDECFNTRIPMQHPSEYLGGWRNQVCARVGAMVGLYNPIKALPKVR